MPRLLWSSAMWDRGVKDDQNLSWPQLSERNGHTSPPVVVAGDSSVGEAGDKTLNLDIMLFYSSCWGLSKPLTDLYGVCKCMAHIYIEPEVRNFMNDKKMGRLTVVASRQCEDVSLHLLASLSLKWQGTLPQRSAEAWRAEWREEVFKPDRPSVFRAINRNLSSAVSIILLRLCTCPYVYFCFFFFLKCFSVSCCQKHMDAWFFLHGMCH